MPAREGLSGDGSLDRWGYESGGAAADIATIAANTPYTTQTDIQEIEISRLKEITLQVKATGGNASAVGPFEVYVLLYNVKTDIPTKESFIMTVVITGATPQSTPQTFHVRHRYMKILKVYNKDPTYAVTGVNVHITSDG